MKNISLYTLKLILSALLSIGFFMSCTEKDPVLDTDPDLPGPNATEVLVRLLIKGEAILPPKTKQMTSEAEGSFKEDLQLLILKKEGSDESSLYYYDCSRPVESTVDGGFAVKVPISLRGSNLKFLLFANSKDLIGNPDEKFKKDGKGITEEAIRKILILTQSSKWPTGISAGAAKKIPMWSEDQFIFTVGDDGATSPTIAQLNLLRMLARVDVGLGYNGAELSSTAGGVDDFILKEVKVYHTGNKGQLMPNPNAYTVTGEGSDKTIKVTAPSIPEGDKENIEPYGIQIPDGTHASERSIYLFEQDMSKSNTDFVVNRPCVLVRGTYTDPTSKAAKDGWYRLDFRNFGERTGYEDVMRNMLYRFNITKVKGPGFTSESDALSSISSNITVELIPMELQQNDIIFDGQSFLSVNKSELMFYRDDTKSNLSLNTNYDRGWEVDFAGETGITANPMSGKQGSAVIEFSWSGTITTEETKTVYIKAGNLRKRILLKSLDENAPGNLTSFSLSPAVLYFAKGGGTGSVTVESNIVRKFLTTLLGRLTFTVPDMIETKAFSVNTSPFEDGSTDIKPVEGGIVDVQVRAANADIKSQCEIKQLTYEKDLDCKPGIMEHGVGTEESIAKLSVPYTTSEEAGTYVIEFSSIGNAGNPGGPTPSNPSEGKGFFDITARPNKTSKEISVGKLTFHPALGGVKIPLLGYAPREIVIKQAPVPAPIVDITTSKWTLDWNTQNHSFTVKVDTLAFVKNNNVSISRPKSNSIEMEIPSSGKLDVPIEFGISPNRTSGTKETTVTATVEGWWGYSQSTVSFTQNPPSFSSAPSEGKTIELGWDATTAQLTLARFNNIFEITVIGREQIGGSSMLPVQGADNGTLFTMASDKRSAILNLTFDQNPSDVDRKVKIKTRAIGNISTEQYTRDFIVSQRGKRTGSIVITGDNPKMLDWDARGFTVGYTSKYMNERSLSLTSNASWITSVSLNKDTKQITGVCSENQSSDAPRSAQITLTGTDEEGVRHNAVLTLTQGEKKSGELSLIPTELNFTRNETTSKRARITKVNIPGTVRVDRGNMPDMIASAAIQGEDLVVSTRENFGQAREATLDVFASDAIGIERRASILVKQESNIVRFPETVTQNSPYKFDEGGESSVFYPSIYLNVEADGLPFQEFKATVDNWDGVHAFQANASMVPSLIGKQVEILVIPKQRKDSYDVLTIPITLTFKASNGIVTTSRLFIKRAGSPYTVNTYLSGVAQGWTESTQMVDNNFVVGRLMPGSILRVREIGGPSGCNVHLINPETGGDFYIKSDGWAPRRAAFRFRNNMGSSKPIIGTFEIYGLGVDGRTKVVSRIEFRP